MFDNNKNFTEATALLQAIESNDLITVKRLLQSKIDLEQKYFYGCTATQVAINLGHLEIAKVLLNAGAKFNSFDEHSIGRAIYNCRLDILSFLIEMGIDVNLKFQENENRTALMEAAQIGDVNFVKKLVESGADANAVSDKNHFALMNAACQGWQEVYDYLAPLTSPELRYWAEKALVIGLIKRQRKDNKLLDDFITAAATGDNETVILKIKNGVEINAFGENGITAIFVAANWGYIPVVRTLIAAGANVDLGEENNGETPLMIAAARTLFHKNKENVDGNCHIEVMKLLIEAGADVNAKTNENWTALIAAANAGSIEAVQLLLKAGADINVKDMTGDTALKRAENSGHQEIAQILKDAGAKEY